MQKAGKVDVCSKHLWARSVPCEGCARDIETENVMWTARRNELAQKLLVAETQKFTILPPAVQSELCSSIILLANEMIRQMRL